MILPPRIPLAHLPTPIHYCSNTSLALGVEIFVKRDDMTGSVLGGNKARKLEFLTADARKSNATILITCGALQSNHARSTAAAAARLGMKSHLFLYGTNPERKRGNLLLDSMFGAATEIITHAEYRDRARLMSECAARYAESGQIAYVIPEGGSNAIGTFGYIAAVEETLRQSQSMGVDFDFAIVAVGSGGTHLGLSVGKEMHGWKAAVFGIPVCDDSAYFRAADAKILEDLRTSHAHNLKLQVDDLLFVDGWKGLGYGRYTPADVEGSHRVAREEGFLLDLVYSQKAWTGMCGMVQSGAVPKRSRVLFWHTSGLAGFFAHDDAYAIG